MKILIFVNASPTLIGFRYDFLKSLRHNGFDVVAVAPVSDLRDEVKDRMNEIGVKLIPINMKRNSLNSFGDIFILCQMIRIIKRENPDTVFSFMLKPVIYGSIAARLCGVKYIQAMIEGLGYSFGEVSLKQRILKIIVTNFYRIAALCANRIYVLNNDDKAFFEREITSAKKVKRIFGIGVDTKKFYPQPKNTKEISFLFVGRLLIEKGIREFIDAAKIVSQKYDNVRFDIVGSVDSNPTCISNKEIQEVSNYKKIVFHGQKSDVRSFLKNSTALVLPSYYREGMPVSVSEAMASERAIIVADTVGSRELLNPQRNDKDYWLGDNGVLVKTHSSEAIANAMIFIVENPDKIDKMAKESRAFAEQVLDKDIINKILIDDLKDALS